MEVNTSEFAVLQTITVFFRNVSVLFNHYRKIVTFKVVWLLHLVVTIFYLSLPFLKLCGGRSLLIKLMGMGILLNISRYNN